MNIFNIIRNDIIAAINQLVESDDLPSGLNLEAITAEPPRDASHGCVATNAAMVIAKPAKSNPRAVAEKITNLLNQNDKIEKVDIAGPGFINLTLNQNIWQNVIKEVLALDNSFGNSNIGAGEKINLEYVSANPTGPMHIGHSRGAVVGDVLARLLVKAGYNVTKEYYINDAGSQIDMLARSTYMRYCEAAGQEIGELLEGMYPGDYLRIVGESFYQAFGDKYLHRQEEDYLPKIKEFALEAMLDLIKSDLRDMGVEHDIFSSEKAIVRDENLDHIIGFLSEKGDYVYQGVLEPPKGKKPEDWEEREQTLFRATEFGDDVDRPLRKSDGSRTYFASDIVYHHNKIERGFNNMILTLGADHGGYVKRMRAAVKALSNDKAKINILIFNLVNFMENGVPLKMSKRAGTYVTVKDVIDAVGKDVLRFIMLTRKADASLDFDLVKVKEQSKDNPVFYVQYAHARINSVLRNVASEMTEIDVSKISKIVPETLTKITSDVELSLVKKLAEWPRIVEAAAKSNEPHRIAFYLQELAANFHSLWSAGSSDENLKFIIKEDVDLTMARLALIKACAITISSGLNVMGVEPVLEM